MRGVLRGPIIRVLGGPIIKFGFIISAYWKSSINGRPNFKFEPSSMQSTLLSFKNVSMISSYCTIRSYQVGDVLGGK